MQRSIEVATPLRAAFAQAREIVLDDPGAVFSEALAVDEQHHPRLPAELSVDLGAGASVHQAVMLKLGTAQSTDTAVLVPVAWRATGRERLFPTFRGELEAFEARSGTRLRLHGIYTVPLGVIGRIGNDVLGWRLARRSLEDLLARLARRIEAEAERRLEFVRLQSSRNPVAPLEWERSEMYIG
jgi:hypothetical protein